MYNIFNIPEYAADSFEQLGTKRKFWFWDDQNQKCLFKEGRPGTGENWAEKVTAELCPLLKLPCAKYELARWKGHRGVITPSFVPEDWRLIPGNELLPHFVENYEKEKRYRQKQHTIKRALIVIRSSAVNPPIDFVSFGEIKTALDVFIGYLLLDAWIANQDRHHENWGLLLSSDKKLYLAPTFDHASSLGRNESDKKRLVRLITRDRRGDMSAYVERATTPFYLSPTGRPLTTIKAFEEAAKFNPEAGIRWLNELESIDEKDIFEIFEKIPSTEMSQPAVDFAKKILNLNRTRLLSVREVLV